MRGVVTGPARHVKTLRGEREGRERTQANMPKYYTAISISCSACKTEWIDPNACNSLCKCNALFDVIIRCDFCKQQIHAPPMTLSNFQTTDQKQDPLSSVFMATSAWDVHLSDKTTCMERCKQSTRIVQCTTCSHACPDLKHRTIPTPEDRINQHCKEMHSRPTSMFDDPLILLYSLFDESSPLVLPNTPEGFNTAKNEDDKDNAMNVTGERLKSRKSILPPTIPRQRRMRPRNEKEEEQMLKKALTESRAAHSSSMPMPNMPNKKSRRARLKKSPPTSHSIAPSFAPSLAPSPLSYTTPNDTTASVTIQKCNQCNASRRPLKVSEGTGNAWQCTFGFLQGEEGDEVSYWKCRETSVPRVTERVADNEDWHSGKVCAILGCTRKLLGCSGKKEAGDDIGCAQEEHVVCKQCLDLTFVAQNELRVQKNMKPLVRKHCPICKSELSQRYRADGYVLGLRMIPGTWSDAP